MSNLDSGDKPTAEQKIKDESFMAQALELAQLAFDSNEVPVGALVIGPREQIIGRGWNQPIARHDPTAHAEIQAIRQAGLTLSNYRLVDCTLYVTLEPCTMCVGAMVHSRLGRIVFGAIESKAGAIVSASRLLEAPYFNHHPEWSGGILAEISGELMSSFFSKRRTEIKRRAELKGK